MLLALQTHLFSFLSELSTHLSVKLASTKAVTRIMSVLRGIHFQEEISGELYFMPLYRLVQQF